MARRDAWLGGMVCGSGVETMAAERKARLISTEQGCGRHAGDQVHGAVDAGIAFRMCLKGVNT